jgi:transposase
MACAAERAAVEALLRRRELAPRVRERAEMVKASLLGQDAGWIAAWTGRSEQTVRLWLDRYARGGLGALADAPRCGRPAKADAAYLAALERAADAAPRALGLGFDVWTAARLSAYLAGATGVAVAPGWLRTLLGRRGFACGRPKHALGHLRDAAAEAACRAELGALRGEGPRGARPVRAAPRRRDPRRNQPLPVPGLAPARPPAAAPGGRRQPAPDRGRLDRAARARPGRGAVRGAGLGLLPAVPAGA